MICFWHLASICNRALPERSGLQGGDRAVALSRTPDTSLSVAIPIRDRLQLLRLGANGQEDEDERITSPKIFERSLGILPTFLKLP